MSRGYRVRVAAPLFRENAEINVNDEVQLPVEMLPILEPEEMNALMEALLKQMGWKQDKEGVFVEREGGRVRWREGNLEIKLEDSQTIQVQSGVQAEARRLLVKREEQSEKALKRRLSEKLIRLEAELQEEVDLVLAEVYRQALRRRAAQMGEILSVEESQGEDGMELTIRVDVGHGYCRASARAK